MDGWVDGWIEMNAKTKPKNTWSDRQGEKRTRKGEEENWTRTSRVEHRGPDPRVDAHVGPCEIKRPHRVSGVHAAAQPVHAEDMNEQIAERERDGSGLLHARDAPEWPLAVVLLHLHTALRR